MDEATFWQIIEQAKTDSNGDGGKLVNLLVERLSLLEVSEIAEFDFLFRQYQSAAYRCDVWEAGNLAYGGLSDDGFTDFRAWLIAQGKDVYEQVLSDPDWLAQVIQVTETDLGGRRAHVKLEFMNYVAHNAYEEKTGDVSEFPYIPLEHPQLLGDWCQDEEKPLIFPNLWAMFRARVE